MKNKIFKKVISGIGFVLIVTTVVIGVETLRFALYAPHLLNNIFHVIGG
ncbi:MAG: hypothetical protein ACI4F3_04010 [Enterocloster sp.]